MRYLLCTSLLIVIDWTLGIDSIAFIVIFIAFP